MRDATILFLTINLVPEQWRLFHREKLLEIVGDAPIITVSAKPMPDMPGINLIQTPPFNVSNIYAQMLRASKIATTKYIIIVEDDTIYSQEHFKFRPEMDRFGYNMSRWGVLSWSKNPVYFYRHRESNSTLIAPRMLTIECLEDRFKRYPGDSAEWMAGEMGKEKVERRFETNYRSVKFHSNDPVVNFHHVNGIDKLEQSKRKSDRKALIAYDIPRWRDVSTLAKLFR